MVQVLWRVKEQVWIVVFVRVQLRLPHHRLNLRVVELMEIIIIFDDRQLFSTMNVVDLAKKWTEHKQELTINL